MRVVPNTIDKPDVRTPDWREMTREQFKARVVYLLAFATNEEIDVPDEIIEELVSAGLEFEVGPYDCACECVDRVWNPGV